MTFFFRHKTMSSIGILSRITLSFSLFFLLCVAESAYKIVSYNLLMFSRKISSSFSNIPLVFPSVTPSLHQYFQCLVLGFVNCFFCVLGAQRIFEISQWRIPWILHLNVTRKWKFWTFTWGKALLMTCFFFRDTFTPNILVL